MEASNLKLTLGEKKTLMNIALSDATELRNSTIKEMRDNGLEYLKPEELVKAINQGLRKPYPHLDYETVTFLNTLCCNDQGPYWELNSFDGSFDLKIRVNVDDFPPMVMTINKHYVCDSVTSNESTDIVEKTITVAKEFLVHLGENFIIPTANGNT
jgi:hypothetical protein